MAATGHRAEPVIPIESVTPFPNGSVLDCLIVTASQEGSTTLLTRSHRMQGAAADQNPSLMVSLLHPSAGSRRRLVSPPPTTWWHQPEHACAPMKSATGRVAPVRLEAWSCGISRPGYGRLPSPRTGAEAFRSCQGHPNRWLSDYASLWPGNSSLLPPRGPAGRGTPRTLITLAL